MHLSPTRWQDPHEDAWGLKLAYPIQKKSTGYHLMEFEADTNIILPFETEFRRDERIIHFLTTKMDKHHIAYAEGRRNKSNRQAAPAEAEGAAEPISSVMADKKVRYLNPIDIETKAERYCRFRKKGIKYIDYKDPDFLLMLCNPRKILPRLDWHQPQVSAQSVASHQGAS